jgi:hypothetical protein
MTRRTRRLLIGLPVALVVLGVVIAWLFWPRTAITRENAARIQMGMTLAEVEAILGGPARDDSSGPRIKEGDPPEAAESSIFLFQLAVSGVRVQHPCKLWESDRVLIRVDFDDVEKRVTGTDFLPVHRRHESPLDLVRRWFRL